MGRITFGTSHATFREALEAHARYVTIKLLLVTIKCRYSKGDASIPGFSDGYGTRSTLMHRFIRADAT